MVGNSGVAERLSALRGRGVVEVAPLWVERLEPGEALRELAERADTVSRLQRAWFLKALGEEREAEDEGRDEAEEGSLHGLFFHRYRARAGGAAQDTMPGPRRK